MSKRNDWIWNNGGTYDTNSHASNNPFNFLDSGLLGGIDNLLGQVLFGDEQSSSQLTGELTGYNSQQREFQQQEYLMDKQNEYNSPVNQMARMKAAGINPNTAASGIAQGGNESAQAPQVSSNTQGASAGLSALAGSVGTIGQVAQVASQVRKNNAEAANQESQALRSNTLLPLDFSMTLEGIGLTKQQARALAIENYYRPQQQYLQTAQMYLQLPMMKKEMDLLDAKYSSEMKSIDVMDQQIAESKGRVDLMAWQKMVDESVARRNNAEADYIHQKFALLRDYGWDPTTGIGGLFAGNFVTRGLGHETDGNFQYMYDQILDAMWDAEFESSEAKAEGSFNVEKGLIKAQEEATKRINEEQRKGEFWNKTFDKWIRVPSSVTVGPYSMSTS